jgi:hypothetical protein
MKTSACIAFGTALVKIEVKLLKINKMFPDNNIYEDLALNCFVPWDKSISPLLKIEKLFPDYNTR